MELFASFDFFLYALLAGLGVSLTARAVRWTRIPLRYVLACVGLATAVLVFQDRPLQPLLVFATQVAALWLRRRKLVPTRVAVTVTMLPLILVKTHTLSFLGMLGLSFMTFRAVDVLLFAHDEERIHPVDYVTYLFLPLTLLAGPMYRWRNFQADLRQGYAGVTMAQWRAGYEALLLGLIQKFAIAHLVWAVGLSQVAPNDYSPRGVLLNSVLYSVYLYFDFAGYSNMALGLGKMFGLNLPINFNNPILSKNPQDFWRRWHISLSEWLRDVVFMPIYKALSKNAYFSRHRFAAQNIGIFATLFCMGVWNGLQWHYIISGILFGVYSVLHNWLLLAARQHPALQRALATWPARLLGRMLTLGAIMLALYVFSERSPF